MYDNEKFNLIPKYSELKFQYDYDFNSRCWLVKDDSDVIASIDAVDELTFKPSSGVISLDMEILDDFNKFKNRPEYKLLHIRIPETSVLDIDEIVDIYEELFAGAAFVRAKYHVNGCNPDDAWPQVVKALNWLRTTDFYVAPASSMYHDSRPGGLCYHSIKVALMCVQLLHCEKFLDNSKLGDAVFCALVHDWCKIDLYESYLRNVKNEQTGVWEKVPSYRYTGSSIINLGHGVSSMFLAQKFFRLNLEEASAIRWHMGAYRTTDAEFNELQSCNEKFPLVHLLQFADQLSLVNY